MSGECGGKMEWHSGAAPVVLNQVLKKAVYTRGLITPSEISDLDAARHFKHDMTG